MAVTWGTMRAEVKVTTCRCVNVFVDGQVALVSISGDRLASPCGAPNAGDCVGLSDGTLSAATSCPSPEYAAVDRSELPKACTYVNSNVDGYVDSYTCSVLCDGRTPIVYGGLY